MKCKHLNDKIKVHFGTDKLDNGFTIRSCCGACDSMEQIIYCPFCGDKIFFEELESMAK